MQNRVFFLVFMEKFPILVNKLKKYNRMRWCITLIELKSMVRYTTLADQFSLDKCNPFYPIINESLERIFNYIYEYTDIMYIEFINETVLYKYIKHYNDCGNNYFQQAIRDVKNYLFFLKCIKKKKDVPCVDLSVQNLELWKKI